MDKHLFSTQLGNRIRARRQSLKMTQGELAAPDFTKSFISQIEKGQTVPSVYSLLLIAERLGCTVGYLVGESDRSGSDISATVRRVGMDPRDASHLLRLLASRMEAEE